MCSGFLFVVAAWLILCRDDKDCEYPRRSDCGCVRSTRRETSGCGCQRQVRTTQGCDAERASDGCGCNNVRVVRDGDCGCGCR